MNELVVVPTYKRPEHLFLCLKFIRQIEKDIPIAVFPDRGTWEDPDVLRVCQQFEAAPMVVPEHDYYGNSMNVMEALKFAYNRGSDRVFYVEDDVMVHETFFRWHREVLEDTPELFASMAWVFNRFAPLDEEVLYQPWYYAVGTCFPRESLREIIKHATPKYYEDMAGYVAKEFRDSYLNRNRPQFGIEHYEQDGLIQRILDRVKKQTASCGTAKCTHLGFFGYNRGWNPRLDFLGGDKTFEQRVERLEALLDDVYERVEIFGEDVVEREVGHKIEPRSFRYKISTPDGFASFFQSPRLISMKNAPAKINSVRVTRDMIIEKLD